MNKFLKRVLTVVAIGISSALCAQNLQLGDYGYLYCHMSMRGEWTAYAISRDGIHYQDIIHGDSIFSPSEKAGIEGGTRDAYICRKHDGSGYLMVTTDMCVKHSKVWNNYGINLLTSDDLIHWNSVTFDFRKGPGIFSDPESPDTYKDYSTINRVWAPQIFWDPNYSWSDGRKGGYMVYFSLLNRAEENYDRMYYSYADETFTTLTKPRLLFDWGYATIDADINYLSSDGLYHMMIKKEGGKPGIFTATSRTLTGPYDEPVEDDYVDFEGKKKCEGVSAFQLIGDSTWRVAYVEYSSRPVRYRICEADKYLRNFHSPQDIQGVNGAQHGSFIRLTKKEYERLQAWSDSILDQRSCQIDVKLSQSTPRSSRTFKQGTAVRPDGISLLCDNKGLLLDNKPILPVMGEIHYARCESKDWYRELMKMKAGGVNIAATYVFWIHHEEEQGVYNWEGNRDLHRFLEACKKADMPVVLRVGPYCHGEVRNGGFPDWVVKSGCKMRSTDPEFLRLVGRWYREIYKQAKGLLWKDGGPIVGIQVENECRGPWPYFAALKDSLVTDGFDVPIYTRTGWPQMNGRATFGEILPLYGDYADGFWDRALRDMPGEYRRGFTFKESRLSTVIASESIPNQTDKMESSDFSYPYFTCELGGGMMTSYHRRINIFDKDALALAICKVGSGSNLPGYYMYHGGTNPEGKYSTLNEAQATLSTNHNDLPIKTYDFQAPLGEMGQINASYYWLRRLHSFLADFGGELSDMDPVFPIHSGTRDPLRWAIRTDGQKGFIFVNNYERMAQLSEKRGVCFTLHRMDGTSLTFPENPFNVPDGSTFCFPFGLDTCGISIEYATAQPVMFLKGKEPTLVLAAVEGIPVEIKMAKTEEILKLKDFPQLVDIPLSNNRKAHILVLDEQTSLQATKVSSKEQDYLVLSDATVWQEKNKLHMEQWGQKDFQWAIYPADKLKTKKDKGTAYLDYFRRFTCSVPATDVPALKLIAIHGAAEPRQVKQGARGVAEQPGNEDFKNAAEWELQGVAQIEDPDNTFISFTYEGDVARVYADGVLVEDNFYNGKPMMIRASQLTGKRVTIQILPLSRHYPIYLQPEQREKLESQEILLQAFDPKVVIRSTTVTVLPIL